MFGIVKIHHVLGPKDVIWQLKKSSNNLYDLSSFEISSTQCNNKNTWDSPVYTQAVVKIAKKIFNLHNPPYMM